MYKLNSILENRQINNLINNFNKSPLQINNPHESDAEIIRVNNTFLAITTDSISEEILSGLYDDPYLIGWMIVTVNLSDLAAVGALPLGILLSQIIPKNYDENKIRQVQNGISDACNAYNTFVLGGDTNYGNNLNLTGTAIGMIKNKEPVSRLGCKCGDILFSSGKLGNGNAFAISKLISQTNSFTNYKPVAQLEYCEVISKYATCCMDTSDGLMATLDQLMRLNEVGFKLNKNWQAIIEPSALEYSINTNIPSWLLFAGQHGEFQLVFTIKPHLKNQFIIEALQNGLEPVEIGTVLSESGIKIPLYYELITLNSTFIRNLPIRTNGDVNHYLKMLLDYDFQLKNEPSLKFTSA